jgi:hypothetical protein
MKLHITTLAAGWLVVSAAIAFVSAKATSAADDDKPKLPELNRKIVQFCTDNLGKKVGDGECAALVFAAVDKASAKGPSDLPAPKPPMMKDDFVWGRLLDAKDDVLPGDIMQFRDVEIKFTSPRLSYSYSYPHHTAIVAEVKGKQKFIVFQQNVGTPDKTDEQRRVVQRDPLDLSAKVRGTVWIYRPIEK